MMRALSTALLLLAIGCGGNVSDPVEHEPQPCTLDPTFRFVPTGGAYELDAAPGTILTGCSDGSGKLGMPYDEVLAPFPDDGPNAEGVVSFKLPPGGCYQVIECVTNADPPDVYPVERE
jgi:hypothetical protein